MQTRTIRAGMIAACIFASIIFPFMLPVLSNNGTLNTMPLSLETSYQNASIQPTKLKIAQISGSQLNLLSPWFELQMVGPYITSFRTDGGGTGNYGIEWIHSATGYQWFAEKQGDTPISIAGTATWQNNSGVYALDFKVGIAFNATMHVTATGKDLQFSYTFTALQDIKIQKNGWVWSLAQQTAGYDVPLVDAVWGYVNGQAQQFITANQFKRRAFVDLFTYMDEYSIQGQPAANALLDFTMNGQAFAMDVLNWNSYLGLVTWNQGYEQGNAITQVTQGTVQVSTFTVQVLPVKSTFINAPAEFPRILVATNDTVGPDHLNYSESLTRLLWDRLYSWLPQGSGEWIDWSSILFDWQGANLSREEQRHNLENIIIDPTGYVYTWGDKPGWPFPDNSLYDTRHATSNPNFITGLYKFWTYDCNNTWLTAQQSRARSAIAWLVHQIVKPGDVAPPGIPADAVGLYLINFTGHHGGSGGIGSNYWDIQPFGWLSAYENAFVYSALIDAAAMESAWVNATGAISLLARASLLKSAYNKVFWDNLKGRYIGVLDEWGQVHDYGFTFINTQAIACGLANESEVHRIYAWMELEPTSSGTNDTFTKWKIAPIGNTDVNNYAALNRTIDDDWWANNGIEPGKASYYPWGPQLQDGGTSMYVSYYDLMARANYLSADNAVQRLDGILDRWGYPDRICGGTPLYFGENPQQEQGGSIGTDYPFPESGMVATAVFYGIMNVTATWTGVAPAGFCLTIDPLLPSSWNNYTITSVHFGPVTMNITVNQTAITVHLPAGITDSELYIEVNGTRESLVTDMHAGTNVFTFGARGKERVIRYAAAQAEWTSQNAGGNIIDCHGNPALPALPGVSSTSLLGDLDAWWSHAINLMTETEYQNILAAVNRIAPLSIRSPPLSPVSRAEYPFVQLERQFANNSLARGDMRWCLVHYQRALDIKERIDAHESETLPTSITTYIIVPAFIIVAIVGIGAFIKQMRGKVRA